MFVLRQGDLESTGLAELRHFSSLQFQIHELNDQFSQRVFLRMDKDIEFYLRYYELAPGVWVAADASRSVVKLLKAV